MMTAARNKIKSPDEIRKLKELSPGLKVVFTNGCFDILHVGHVRYLEEAKALGDILVVGVNSDSSVKKIKGVGRPINTEGDRAELVASLEAVDYVTLFNEETPVSLIGMIEPDIHAKGGDYAIEELPEAKAVESYGGKVVILPEVGSKSTSALISRIRERNDS